ncbi:MAG: DUF859 family phage minor structural protein, partial [Acutalibacteraceae bacterium]
YGAYNLNTNNTIKLSVGGVAKVNNTAAKIDLRTGTGTTLATWTGNVAHNSDGTLNLALSGYFYFNSSAATSLPKGGYTVSGTAALDTIPRKSSVSCTDANVGSSAVITINRASSSFTHTLTYVFGSLSGTIATKTSSMSIGWTLPTSFYAQMTKRTLQGTITCETFNGSTSLGTTTCTFTATAVDTVTVSGTVVDTNSVTVALTGDASKLIRYFSTAKATIAASTNNSATITSKTINGAAVSADRTFTNCEINKFTFYAKDSRDYSDSDTVELTMIPYVKLTVNAAVKRDTPTGNAITLTVKGNYYNGSFGATANTIGINYRFREAGTTSWAEDGLTPTINGNTYTASVNLTGFDYRTEYEFEISVADRLSGDVAGVDVVRGQPVFDWGKSDFNFNVPVAAPSMTLAGKTVPTIETGTWTPVLSGSVTYASRSGRYIKVGNLVWITCDIKLSSKGSTTSALTITGLPFQPTANTALVQSFDYATKTPQVAIADSTNFIRLTHDNNGSWNTMTHASINDGFHVLISGCYPCAG